MPPQPPVPYADPPGPGTYFIANRAVPGNLIEIHPENEGRAVCSPDSSLSRQMVGESLPAEDNLTKFWA
ncbi:hypothetical protein AG1IA_00264 [Rhizoctonia solani AG-1 IA]|uniref:Uncharacterized protein n=1 Tax=Thanatephorus cucumeris (strain AG1-IA) TaxID=983506 RepID=L8X9D4_THACA|nr:hypothetical protein AG1IA_00264 [Rhizoctonia solani AG-1 IA]